METKKGSVQAIREASAKHFERRAEAIWKRIGPAHQEMEACIAEAKRLRDGMDPTSNQQAPTPDPEVEP